MFDLLGSYLWTGFIYLNIAVMVYFMALNLSYFSLLVVSFFYIRRQNKVLNTHDFSGIYKSSMYPSFSIIVPAYNEERDIVDTVRWLLQQKYGEYEVIIVNDGSTDQTLPLLKEYYDLYKSSRYINKSLKHEPIRAVYESSSYPHLIVIDKENGQRADAMNAGLNAARKDLFCAVDADSFLEHDVLLKMLRSFARDENTIAVGGIIRVANGCYFENGELKKIAAPASMIPLVQVIEYIRSFLFGRIGWEYFNSLILISGAFGVFDRQAVLNAGGYYTDAIGEDFELTVKLHKYYRNHNLPYKITFQPEPVCWTEVPDDWASLSSQRNRWQRGLLQTLWRFKEMIFNPRYGTIGMVALPFYFLFELLGPAIEIAGYAVIIILLFTGTLPPDTGLLFFIVAVLLGVILSFGSLACDELTFRRYPKKRDLSKIAFASIIENFGYRQLHTWWRVKGMITYWQGDMKWSRSHTSRTLLNALQWIGFAVANMVIIYLFYYGLRY